MTAVLTLCGVAIALPLVVLTAFALARINTARDEDRRLLVAEHIVSNAIQTGVVLGDGRGALSGNLYTKLVAGRAAAGDLLTGNLMRIYNAASSTSTNPSSTTPQNPSPAPKTGGEGAKVEVELAITGQI